MNSKYLFLFSFALLWGCQKVDYDFKALGFTSKSEMEAAFAKGYHTKSKLEEMDRSEKPSIALDKSSGHQAVAEPLNEKKSNDSLEKNTEKQPETASVGPSFDCGKAVSSVEKLICNDKDLSQLDLSLAASYKKAASLANDKFSLRQSQLEWLKNERNSCPTRECLVQAITNRISALEKN